MFQQQAKWGLGIVAIFQIFAIFFMLHFYNKLVSNPDNYYKNILTDKDKSNSKIIEEVAPQTTD